MKIKRYINNELIAPTLFGMTVLITWWAIIRILGVKSYVFPTPVEILSEFFKHYPLLWPATEVTAIEAIVGLGFGFIAASLIATFSSKINIVRKSLAPYLVILQTTPIPAVAPLFVLWFGEGIWSRIMSAFAICVVPMTISMTQSLMVVDGGRSELYQVFGYGPVWRFLNVTVPLAIPGTISALQFGVMLAVVGAVVGELVTADGGVGYVIIQSSYSLDTPLLFAAIACAALIGFVLFSLVRILSVFINVSKYYIAER
jgi:NitT/TauT family transport system permease protein